MLELLLVIHLLICAAMIAVVLLQKSEGGALGIGGGGGGGGGFLTGRGTANLLTRTTAILAAAFFATSITLSVFSGAGKAPPAPFSAPAGAPPSPGQPPIGDRAPGTGGAQPGPSLLDSLKQGQGGQRLPSIPESR